MQDNSTAYVLRFATKAQKKRAQMVARQQGFTLKDWILKSLAESAANHYRDEHYRKQKQGESLNGGKTA